MDKFILVLFSTILFFLAPERMNSPFIWTCICIYVYTSVRIIKTDLNKEIPFSFNILFLPFLFICSYVVPLVKLYRPDVIIWYSAGLVDEFINQACALVALSITLYRWGYFKGISSIPKTNRISSIYNSLIIKSFLLIAIVVFAFQLRDNILGTNSSNDFSDGYAIEIIQGISYISIFISIYSNKNKIKGNVVKYIMRNKMLLCTIVAFCLGALYIGDRTLPMFLGIYTLAVFQDYVKRIQIKYILLVGLPLFIVFYMIGQTRSSDNSLRKSGVSQLVEITAKEITRAENAVVFVGDFMPSFITLDRALYICHRDNTYVHNPDKVFVIAASPIPGLPSLLSDVLMNKTVKELSSAYVITSDYNRAVERIAGGMGTHIVGDIYYHWSIVGIFILFPIFGYVLGKATLNRKKRILDAVIFYTMLAGAIFMPRDTMYLSVRLICYQLLLYYFIKSLVIKRSV